MLQISLQMPHLGKVLKRFKNDSSISKPIFLIVFLILLTFWHKMECGYHPNNNPDLFKKIQFWNTYLLRQIRPSMISPTKRKDNQ